jgi:hypothetical protein
VAVAQSVLFARGLRATEFVFCFVLYAVAFKLSTLFDICRSITIESQPRVITTYLTENDSSNKILKCWLKATEDLLYCDIDKESVHPG